MSTAAVFSPEQMIKSIPAARIASIAPVEFRARMQVTRGFHDYVMPAAKRGEVSYLDIPAEMIHIADFHDDRRVQDKPMYEDPRQRAQKLAQMWSYPGFGDRIVGRFGVRVLPEGATEASPELVAEMTREQEALANSALTDATDKRENGMARQISDKFHRPLAVWLMGNGVEDLPWYGKRDFSQTKPCPKCRNQINAAATGCQHCGVDLIEWWEKNDPAGCTDAVIVSWLEKRRAARQAEREAARAQAAPIPPPQSSIRPPIQQPVK